ncbi:MAG: aldehyde dehydrogenase family protein [Pseudomonadota bacterium]|nr:aldehyde dehydrogenase family protein [Pseudomonadota bacterium]MDE3038616.1 aldehyde dehydrogenase family protein [Pseudomonadota bacterium]
MADVMEIFESLGMTPPEGAMSVRSPRDGGIIASLMADTPKTLEEKIACARVAQLQWQTKNRNERAWLLETLAAAIKRHREPLATLMTMDSGKTMRESLSEVDGAEAVLLKTIRDAALPEFNGMLRCKERQPAGVVGLITSFNFPCAVAHWSIAPALLAGNAVLWKPSEKAPLVAQACKMIFDKAGQGDLLQMILGGRDIGAALVAHEGVDMVSATGSAGMGKAIRAALAAKKNNAVKPILELGGNNGVILSEKMSEAHLDWSLAALLASFLGTAGQRCTNTRRLFVQKKIHGRAVRLLERKIADFLVAGPGKWEEYGYGPLIDAAAFARFEQAKKRVAADGGEILFGNRLLQKEYPDAYYAEPALALLSRQTPIMHEETFAPLLFIVPYHDLEEAIAMANAPSNAGLVAGIYTKNQAEADMFAARCEAGHCVINSPKGTGTPAFGMGFGGNKDSGEGEILNAADPLAPFTRPVSRRIAQDKDVAMDA